MGRWRYTSFYGCPERNRRRESWNLLKSLSDELNLPWCVIRDFNDMIYIDEKMGRMAHPYHEGFTEIVLECGLRDLGFVGEKFTWEKSRGQQN